METVKIVLEITSRKKCPHFDTSNQWSSDGWDRMEDWNCKKENGKKIAGCVEWHEESKIKIPDWCPIRLASQTGQENSPEKDANNQKA